MLILTLIAYDVKLISSGFRPMRTYIDVNDYQGSEDEIVPEEREPGIEEYLVAEDGMIIGEEGGYGSENSSEEDSSEDESNSTSPAAPKKGKKDKKPGVDVEDLSWIVDG